MVNLKLIINACTSLNYSYTNNFILYSFQNL